jgi:hypothetical protein
LFHVVFTVLDDINPVGLRNPRVIFQILFRAASQTLLQIARDPKHLGAQVGISAVLHTWGQNLLFHPHLHCVVTGGGLSPDGTQWIAGRDRYLFPVPVLSKLYRGKFLDALHRAWTDGELELAGSTAELAEPARWAALKDTLYRKRWVVYAKAPFGGPEHVFRYLGHYTHRVAISNHRLVAFEDGRVTFRVRDRSDPSRRTRITLDAGEFIRRFLLHVLPKGFVRIRHYGLCAGRNVHTRLATARRRLDPEAARAAPASSPVPDPPWWQRFRERTGVDVMACPRCSDGRLVRREAFSATSQPPSGTAQARASPVPA